MKAWNCLWLLVLFSCKKGIKEQEDKIYSRHLQQHIRLTIFSTPVPDDKRSYNLLLLNNGDESGKLRVKEIMDSLNRKKLLNPLLVVAIHPDNSSADYGVADHPLNNKGVNAGKYSAFVNDELYFFIKKKAGVQKFSSITIAGCSNGGLSALDIAWDHADRINKVGVFSLSPGNGNDSMVIIDKIRSSKKRPQLQYWFYAADNENTDDRDKDGIINVVDDTKDIISLIESKNGSHDITFNEIKEGRHDYQSWSHAFPAFLLWVAGK